MKVHRIYVEKKPEFDEYSKQLLRDIQTNLNIQTITNLRILNRYDVEGIELSTFYNIKEFVFYEKPLDLFYDKLPLSTHKFAIEYLPGQYNQRSDSCEQLIQIITKSDRPIVKHAMVYLLDGVISDSQLDAIKKYLINPIETKIASLNTSTSLIDRVNIPSDVPVLQDFINLDKVDIAKLIDKYQLSMDLDDLIFCQDYFKQERKNPSLAELKMIDTYWSDHCRHTTFLTHLNNIAIEDEEILSAFKLYNQIRNELGYNNKPITLMDIATIPVKYLKKIGLLKNIDESDEINACSVKIKVDVNSNCEDWILMFKNETHNHPTEIEPFGGAATCLGGAIRDPLSGRTYVYQAMRISGASNPLKSQKNTLNGKLSQHKIVTTAAKGYSSYGNQIGLSTGLVKEVYHKGYVAKHLETGAVVGAAKASHIIRQKPVLGDAVILVGGKTGRDGCGGATGSSLSHNKNSLDKCGAQVQKGNPIEERKLQRLFRNKKVTRLIKKCNDFGAGGVCVAVGELADGLDVYLDKIPTKYQGIDGIELTISESQERMAVLVSDENIKEFINLAESENLLATKIATVTNSRRFRAFFKGKEIINLSRNFLDSSGATKFADVKAKMGSIKYIYNWEKTKEGFKSHLGDLNIASLKGLVEQFDSTIGASTVLMPYGGKYQLTESQVMAAKIPTMGNTKTTSIMSYGFNPHICEQNPFYGAQYAVIESIAKVVAAGGDLKNCYLTFQEYFEKLRNDPSRWSKPFSALLGALVAQCTLKIASIGGKDSMSGSFEEIDVPPTLISFAVSLTTIDNIISTEFKKTDSPVVLLLPNYSYGSSPNYESIIEIFEKVQNLIREKKVLSAWALSTGSVAEAICKMCFGNKIGFAFNKELKKETLFNPIYGGFVLELKENTNDLDILGYTTLEQNIVCQNEIIPLDDILKSYNHTFETVYKTKFNSTQGDIINPKFKVKNKKHSKLSFVKPNVLIPIFPGTNCEYDTIRQFERADANTISLVINNMSPKNLAYSALKFGELLKKTQILMLPGGFSGGDEPDGSAKFIAAFLRHPLICDEIQNLIDKRDGLILGICNGFQALLKLGLLPFGQIKKQTDDSPILTHNTLFRHQSKIVTTKICSNKSPWLYNTSPGQLHKIAISHGEGRFIASNDLISNLAQNGQIATQYVDLEGNPTYNIDYNPNGSTEAIEGITSKDGRILGKMGHSERIGYGIHKNVEGLKDQKLFKAGVDYFK